MAQKPPALPPLPQNDTESFDITIGDQVILEEHGFADVSSVYPQTLLVRVQTPIAQSPSDYRQFKRVERNSIVDVAEEDERVDYAASRPQYDPTTDMFIGEPEYSNHNSNSKS